ncbi:MAG: polyhydroxyalkanoate synthesis repressor PhaR [Rhodospirillales bacterium]|nr:polyhydroxyalkanoate synthesis repressor PhaR [Rhodospirillales bacterium]
MNEQTRIDAAEAADRSKITIKKYANRRLYNTATSCYVTLDYLSQLVKAGADFAVYDAKSGEDITRSVLTHIIVEEEAKGHSMLPVSFLRHLISFYGDSLQVVVPRYLEQTMQAFAHNQESLRSYLRGTFDPLMPLSTLEEMGKQQLALFEQAMRMFTPFYVPGEDENADKSGTGRNGPAGQPKGGQADVQLDELRQRLDSIQNQLNDLRANRSK